VTGDEPIWKPEKSGPRVAAIWAIIWLSPRSMPSPMLAELATIGSMSGRHLGEGGDRERGAVHRDHRRVDRDTEQ